MSDIADLSLIAVTKRFGGIAAVDAVDFEVAQGEFFSILGPSGCGKTTLMRMIAGFESPTSGDIRIRGVSMLAVPANKRPVNMVFQSLALFPMMSVGENIGYGLACAGVSGPEAAERIARILDRVGLSGFGPRAVTQLSGGQRQRVAIARCLVLEPTLVLLDEPLGALDLKLREHMKIELKQLQSAFNTTFMYITHDQSEALVMSDRVAVMNKGRFEQVGTPRELYHNPKTSFVAGFVGDANIWSGSAAGAIAGGTRLKLATGAEVTGMGTGIDDGVRAYLRPEAIALAGSLDELSALPNRFPGTVSTVLFDGAASTLVIDAAGFPPLRATLPQAGPLAGIEAGAAVAFGFTPEALKIFPA
ncbi:MAG: putative spermidine/putrescine transport system ATP-binding [Beijerinckiaceae bacterium]|nr:MAG: putative spermidine/putrescine transport system ATP-binding [Beijerinckiaceae bacterium]